MSSLFGWYGCRNTVLTSGVGVLWRVAFCKNHSAATSNRRIALQVERLPDAALVMNCGFSLSLRRLSGLILLYYYRNLCALHWPSHSPGSLAEITRPIKVTSRDGFQLVQTVISKRPCPSVTILDTVSCITVYYLYDVFKKNACKELRLSWLTLADHLEYFLGILRKIAYGPPPPVKIFCPLASTNQAWCLGRLSSTSLPWVCLVGSYTEFEIRVRLDNELREAFTTNMVSGGHEDFTPL